MEPTVIDAKTFLHDWQGHRALTRRVIEAFPEDKLFTYSIGGMRPFSGLAKEMLTMGSLGIQGAVTGQWTDLDAPEQQKTPAPQTKAELLARWDELTSKIDTLWPQITGARFQEIDMIFNAYKGPIYWGLLYLVDNEVHHRGQGYVYLRSLGIEPPPFWDRHYA
jgi:uncharacterized damage-inducible protein DinB